MCYGRGHYWELRPLQSWLEAGGSQGSLPERSDLKADASKTRVIALKKEAGRGRSLQRERRTDKRSAANTELILTPTPQMSQSNMLVNILSVYFI